MTDCSHLTGRMRQICDGTSGLSEEKRQAYLRSWSMKSATATKSPAIQTNPPVTVKPEPVRHVPVKGSVTGKLFAESVEWVNLHAPNCQCRDYVAIMNQWGPEKCREKRSSLITWWQNVAKKQGVAINNDELGSLIDAAIQASD